MKRLILIFFAANVLGFAFLSHSCSQGRLQRNLERTVQGQLSGQNELARVRFDVRHLDVVLTGQVSSDAARRELIGQIRKALPAGRVRSKLEIEPMVDAELIARLDQGILRLEGRVPSEELVRELEAAGKGLGVSVLTHGLTPAENVTAPPWATGASGLLARFFEDADFGTLHLTPTQWRLQRQAETPQMTREIRELAIAVLPVGVKLIDELSIRPPDRPGRLEIAKNGDAIVISGVVPGEAHRAFIARSVTQALGQNVRNELRMDRQTRTPEWLPALSHVLPVLFDDGSGQLLAVEGTEVRIAGKLATPEEVERILEVAGNAFGIGYVVESSLVVEPELRPAPAHLELEARFSAEKLSLTGIVPNAEIRDRIIGGFRRTLPEAELAKADFKLDSRVPEPVWLEALLDLTGRLNDHLAGAGSLQIADRSLKLTGNTRSRASHHALELKIRQMLGSDFVCSNETTPPKSSEFEPKARPWSTIYFASGSSRISSDERGKIDYASLKFRDAGPQAVMLIQAFADRSGLREQNLSLGNRRAQVVRQALVDEGVPSAAIAITGVKIVESSGTPDLDRRVEFVIVP